ncbi:hypothetical protein [Xylophilus sp.]|uniref:hypothetical protein n=1 Tax=Xylophilus sp. TaxID=2653893 RepID=UPI0013B63839|nr:hypothetical protein [Xylophilus sp.]KAF1049349.1 MAG: hypothetical protein GAK38_00805 [Xylophilus sp.]
MSQRFVAFLGKAEAVLEKLSDRAALKAQAKLAQASALVTEANALRKSAKTGRRVAQALRDLTADTAPAPVANESQAALDL